MGAAVDARRATDAARRAFDEGLYSPTQRAAAMRRFQAALTELSDRIVDASIREAGITRMAVMEAVLPIAAGHLELAITECSRDVVESLPLTTVPTPGASTLGGGVCVP